jgi:glycosyltransferase involved in cell wall biosynthesis
MNTTPLVSVVIPCYNQARYLAGALSSVRRQDWPSLESIVIDDGSSDDTSRVAELLGASLVKRQPNRGLSHARNAGLEIAAGEFIVFLDADDELLPGAIHDGCRAFARMPGVDCIAGRCRLIDTGGRPLPTTYPPVTSGDLYAELLKVNFIWTPGAAMFRTSALRAMGGFPVTEPAAADYAVMLALARNGRLAFETRDVVRYRKHDANMSRDPMLMLGAVLSVLNRERPFIPDRCRETFTEGRRRWRAFYGEQLNVQLRHEWRGARRPWRLVKGAVFYFWHCPRDFVVHFWRKFTRVIRKLPPSEIDQHGRERAQPLL